MPILCKVLMAATAVFKTDFGLADRSAILHIKSAIIAEFLGGKVTLDAVQNC